MCEVKQLPKNVAKEVTMCPKMKWLHHICHSEVQKKTNLRHSRIQREAYRESKDDDFLVLKQPQKYKNKINIIIKS